MNRPEDLDPRFRETSEIASRSTYADLSELETPSRILGTASTFLTAIVKPVAFPIDRATRRRHR